MSTLGIFTVKRLSLFEGNYYTYGGFGDYLASMRVQFDRTILVAHVKEMPPPTGHYQIPGGEDLEIVGLPQVRSEIGTWLTMPIVFWRAWQASKGMDLAHARMPNHTGIIGAFICRLRGIPVFCQVIADWYVEAQRMPVTRKYGLGLVMKLHLYLYDLMERLVCRGQLVFAQGRSCCDKHAQHSNCELVLSTAHHVEDIIPPLPRFERRPYTILTVARLTGVKNHTLILQALAKLSSDGEDWRVVFVGEGPHREKLEAEVATLGLNGQVTFVGQIERGKQLWQYYDKADCFVLSSRSEGTPKVLLEAMARGLPIVASAVAGVPTSVAHEERGLLFNDNDVTELVASIRRMEAEPVLRERMVANAHTFCREHTVEVATANMLQKVFKQWPHFQKKSAMPK